MSKQKYPQTQNSARGTDASTAGRRLKKEYCSDKLHAKRDRKRCEAEARQHVYSLLTLEAKMSACNSRRGASAREWERLTGERLKTGGDRSLFNLKP